TRPIPGRHEPVPAQSSRGGAGEENDMDPLRSSGGANRLPGLAPAGATSGPPCPRCQEPLWDIADGRWCSACGYRQTGAKGWAPRPETAERPTARRKTGEWAEMPRLVPRWVWVLLGGVAVVSLASVNAGTLLPPNSWSRAVWTTTQV